MPLIKHRGLKGLKFSILCDVFLLNLLFLISSIFVARGQNIDIVPDIFSEADLVLKPIGYSESKDPSADQHILELSRRFDAYGDYNKSPHDTIHRILRDEDTTSIRGDIERLANTRRKKTHPKLWKREIVQNASISSSSSIYLPNNSANSTKSLDLVNSNLTKFVIDSDLELQLKQSDDRLKITRLNLTNNLLTEFRTEVLNPGLQRVTQLDLANNCMTTFVLNEQSSLETLNLSGNNILNFHVDSNRTRLHSLSIKNNNMSTKKILGGESKFDLRPIATLETLDLSCNQLTQVNSRLLGSGRSLVRLNLSRNRLHHIGKDAFYNLLNIQTLVLSHNHIESIDSDTFMVLSDLEYLDLSYNAIEAESIRSLQGIPDLVGLSIAYNPNLGEALDEFVASWSLKELDASGTGLCRIPTALAQSVRILVLADNWFEIIRSGDLDSYPLLQYLDLSHSHVVDIDDDAMGRLEMLQTLFLDHNQLKRIPVSLPRNLENLFLQNNEIIDIQPQSLKSLTNLRTLDLSHNKLTYIPGLPLPKLLVLNLQSSGLRGLSQSVVKTSPKLRELLLDNNPIKCTELMGIAEWASPCQTRDTLMLRTYSASSPMGSGEIKSYQQDIKKAFIQTHDYLVGFPDMWQMCPGWTSTWNKMQQRTPLCATSNTHLLPQSKKVETQFNESSIGVKNVLSVLLPKRSNEEIENSIDLKAAVATLQFPGSQTRRVANKSSRNSPDKSQGKLSQDGSIVGTPKKPSEIFNANVRILAMNNLRETKSVLADTRSSTLSPISFISIEPDSLENQTQIISFQLTQLSDKTTRRQERKRTSDKDIFKSTMPTGKLFSTVDTAATSQQNGVLGTKQLKLQHRISTNSQGDNLTQPFTETSSHSPTILSMSNEENYEPELSLTANAIPSINTVLSHEIKTTTRTGSIQTKRTILGMHRIGVATPVVEQQNISQKYMSTAPGHLPSAIEIVNTTIGTTTKHLGRILSEMSSSKVNKDYKVVDRLDIPISDQLSPSAINENSIIKRNQNSSSYYTHRQLLSSLSKNGEGITTTWPTAGNVNADEKLIQLTDTTSIINQHNASQQNPQRTMSITGDSADGQSISEASTKKKSSLLVNKMKDDKHLRFVGAKNLNLTVLTYNRKGQIHKTINKDISPRPRQSSPTVQPQQQHLGEISVSIETQSTISTTQSVDIISSSIPLDQPHVRVNRKRIANNSNNRLNIRFHERTAQDEIDIPPQLNVLHALAVATHNSSNNPAAGLTPPADRWLDIRSATGRPELLVGIVLTVGVFCILGLMYIYRCRRPALWREPSLTHLPVNSQLPHCCSNTGIETGSFMGASSGSNLQNRSPGHFCRYSYNTIDNDTRYYIELEQSRIRRAMQRDFLPMELLRSSTASGSCRRSKNKTLVTSDDHNHSVSRAPSIW